MTAARLKYRTNQEQALENAYYEIAVLQRENTELRERIAKLQKEIENLKQ